LTRYYPSGTGHLIFEAIPWDDECVLVDSDRPYFQAACEALAIISQALTEDLYHQLFIVEARGAWHLADARLGAGEAVAARKQSCDHRYVELLKEAVICSCRQ
jgi:hypothetical protein